MSGQDQPLPQSNGEVLAGTDELGKRANSIVESDPPAMLAPVAQASTEDPKATQKVYVDGKFKLEDLPSGVIPFPRIDGYEILSVLGRGGMGVVYKAREIKLQRLVALKMILAGTHASLLDLQRFQTEARAVAKLQHPNIVQIHDIGEQDGQNFFSLELVNGGNLTGKIDSKPQPPRQAAQLVEVLARAVYYAHEHNIVHRDLKPGNILLTADGTPKITDFGLAKQLDSEQGQTKSGAIVGTPSYMAPEQARGQTKILGPAADIYSLGAILYELLTGWPPFLGETPMDTLFLVAYEDAVPPSRLHSKVPRDLEVICMKCLEKDPNRRYLTAQALANDLARFLANEPILARPLSAWERGGRWVKRHKAKTALAAAILIAVAGVGAGLLGTRSIDRRRIEEKQHVTSISAEELKYTVEGKAWETIPITVNEIRSNLASDPELGPIREAVEQELRISEERFQAREFHRDFLALLDDSMFQLSMALGQKEKLDKLENRSWNALKTVGIEPGHANIRLDEFKLLPQEKKTILEGCYQLLLTLADLKKGAEAWAILELGKELPCTSQKIHLLRANHLEAQHQFEPARRERELAHKQRSKAIDFFLTGNGFYVHGELEEASKEYAQALQLQPDYFWARYHLALCDIRLGQPARARDNLTACAAEKGNIVWVYLMRGFAEGQLKNYEAAERDFHTALAMISDKHSQEGKNALYVLYNNRGVMRTEQKDRFVEGVQDLQDAVRLSPKKYHAYASLSEAYSRQKDWTEAVRYIDQASTYVDDSITQGLLYRYRARYHSELHDDSAALADLDKEIALESSDGAASPKALVLRGRLLQKNHRSEDALQSFDAALKVQSHCADALRGRAEILYEMKKYPESIGAFCNLIRTTAPCAQDYKLRGLAKSQTGDHQGEAEDYSRALDLENKAPDSEKKKSNLVWLRIHRGNAELAIQADRLAMADFEEVLRHDSKNGEALCGRGLARVRMGQIDTGVQDAQHALHLFEPTSRICYQSGRIYALAAGKINMQERKDRQTADKRRSYEDRALALIRQSLALLPSNERAAFWQDYVAKDTCLAPIRRTVAFSQIETQYPPKSKSANAGSGGGPSSVSMK